MSCPYLIITHTTQTLFRCPYKTDNYEVNYPTSMLIFKLKSMADAHRISLAD